MNHWSRSSLIQRLLPGRPSISPSLKRIHFLHVSKAAGTQIQTIIDQINANSKLVQVTPHFHEATLDSLSPNQEYFFSTRDPIQRFKSGFYSRKRKGRPRIHVEWSEHEEYSFNQFEHANDLAESLFSPGKRGLDAIAAMRSIRHCSRNFVDWFKFTGHLFELRPPIWIIRQEHFEADLKLFLARIGYSAPVTLQTDIRISHANDYSSTPDLSESAKANLRQWYVQDYEFLRLCEAWISSQEN